MLRSGVIFAGVLMLVACHRTAEIPATTTTTAGQVVNNGDAEHKLTRARCDRELICGDIGEKKEFSSWDRCEIQNSASTKDDLKSMGCSKGLDHQRLDECIAAIRAEKCSNKLDTIDRVDVCRRGRFCVQK